jgi:hypothetical protein
MSETPFNASRAKIMAYAETMANSLEFTREIAALTKDGEKLEPDGELWVMENDDAFDTLHNLISQARAILCLPDPPEEVMPDA